MPYLAPPPEPAPVVIMRDIGADYASYLRQTDMYRASNREVRLGECRSACTLALSLPRVCVYKSSILRFNQIFDQDSREIDVAATDALFRSYPVKVRAHLGYLTRKYKTLSGAKLISLGIRDCAAGSQPGHSGVAATQSATARPVYVPPGHGPAARFLRRMKRSIVARMPDQMPGADLAVKLPSQFAAVVGGVISKTIATASPQRWFASTPGRTSNAVTKSAGQAPLPGTDTQPQSIATLTPGVVRDGDDAESPVRASKTPLPPPRPVGASELAMVDDTRRLPQIITGAYPALPAGLSAYAPLR